MHPLKKRKVAMDAASIVSAFLSSSNQYVVCRDDNNVMQLQRHLEVVDCLTSSTSDLAFFLGGSPQSSRCVALVVDLLLDTRTKPALVSRALSILQNLSKCGPLVKSLQSVFHVHSAVSSFLQQCGSDLKNPLVLQCLDVLQRVTCGVRIEYLESHFENLVSVLLKLAESESNQLLKVVLKILSNLVRHNPCVQSYISSFKDSKQFIKRVVGLLNTEEPRVIVYVLSILANLDPNFPLGVKLWTDNHVMTAFQVIFKLIFSSDNDCSTAALGLFEDLMAVPKHESCFAKSYFNSLLKRVPKMLSESNNDKSVIFLQILCCLVKVPTCREKIHSVLFEICENTSSGAIKTNYFIDWCVGKNVSSEVSKLSVNLVQDLVVSNIDKKFDKIESSVKEIIKRIFDSLSAPDLSSLTADHDIERLVCIFEILNLLWKKTNLKNFIFECSNVVLFEEICLSLLQPSKTDECEDEKYLHLFLTILELISLIKKDASKLEKLSSSVFEDHKSVKYIAWGLTSTDQNHVKQALSVIPLIKSDSYIHELSKSIFLLPKKFGPSQEINCSAASSDTGSNAATQRPLCDSNHSNNCSQNQIDALLSKIEKGLHIKDLKQSEIMEIYEHKIAVLARKEQELQNYIDAKTAALQKADQIMTQYKCRQADSDAEAVRLRTMVKEYENRCEQAVANYEEALQRSREQKEELDLALSKVRELQNYEKEQNELMQTQMNRQYEQKKVFEEEKARFLEALHNKDNEKKALIAQIQQMEEDLKSKTNSCKALEEARDESAKKVKEFQKSMDKMKLTFEQKQADFEKALDSARQTIASLEQKNETLTAEFSTKIENYSSQILELEGEKETMKEHLKLKETKILDLSESIRSLSSQLSEKGNALLEAEKSNKKLESSVAENKSKITKLEKDVNMYELLCKKYEKSLEQKQDEIKSQGIKLEECQRQWEKQIEEKDKQVKDMEAELEKYKNITEMINQITSGKNPRPKK